MEITENSISHILVILQNTKFGNYENENNITQFCRFYRSQVGKNSTVYIFQCCELFPMVIKNCGNKYAVHRTYLVYWIQPLRWVYFVTPIQKHPFKNRQWHTVVGCVRPGLVSNFSTRWTGYQLGSDTNFPLPGDVCFYSTTLFLKCKIKSNLQFPTYQSEQWSVELDLTLTKLTL